MSHRPLPLRLLAPTVLVSLVLVVASASAALYLRWLHVDVSRVLAENVESTLAAKDLQLTVKEMMEQLRGPGSGDPRTSPELTRRVERAREQLERTRQLANHEEERQLVTEIQAGLTAFAAACTAHDETPAELASRLERRVLPACQKLQNYNTNQVGASNVANARIVELLTWGLLLVGVVAPLSGLLLGFSMARRLHRSIYQLSVRIRDAAGRPDGESRPVTLVEADGSDGLDGHLQEVVHEVERVFRRLEQREREVLRAEQLAAVGQVAAGVAHELRNPLTSVKMLVQTGLEGPRPAGLPPEDLAIIEHEIRRMEACIQTFLDFARPPSAERKRRDLAYVVRRALALVEGRARRQQVKLEAELPAGPVELQLDAEQVHQVLVNLLLNALDALPHGGTVRVVVRGPAAGEPFATVAVHDSGPGIAVSIRPRLFQPFVSGKETGLGLGLSICRRLVEAHGGAIRGENDPKGGALFTFTLPA
jgi:signal transduction histidine kinase